MSQTARSQRRSRPGGGLRAGVRRSRWSRAAATSRRSPAARPTRTARTACVCSENKCVECTEDAQCPKGKRCRPTRASPAPECSKRRPVPARPGLPGRQVQAVRVRRRVRPGRSVRGRRVQAGRRSAPRTRTAPTTRTASTASASRAARRRTPDARCQLQTVYFGFDDSSIQASERDRLDANAPCIEKNKGKSVLLIGHTDTSGTEEYNIALSERRAQSVADYLARLGS